MWEQYAFFETRDDWFAKDFSKPNSTRTWRQPAASLLLHPSQASHAVRRLPRICAAVKGGARHAAYLPQAEEVWWRRNDDGGLHITVKSAFERYAVQSAGAPKVLWTEIRCAGGAGRAGVLWRVRLCIPNRFGAARHLYWPA